MFKLAELFVDVKARDEQLHSTLNATRSSLTGWGVGTAAAVGMLAAGAIASAASAIGSFFADGVSGAVDLQETLSKVNAIFGDSAGVIVAQADEMAAKFGVVKQSFLDAASGFGASFKAAGLTGDAAAEVGNRLAKLGMDMASFGNASNEEVFTALNAALRGEFDPLERFNVMLSANAVAEAAVAQGLAKNKNEVDELAKKQATLNLIMAKTQDQQGDLERTADGSANQWRRLTGTLTNLSVELGGALEPALNAVLVAGNAMLDGLGPGIVWLGGLFQGFADMVLEAVETVSLVWRNLGDVWELVTINAREMYGNLIAVLGVLPDNVGRIAGWIGRNWYQLIKDGFDAAIEVVMNFGENLGNLAYAVFAFLQDPTQGFNFEWKPLLDGFESAVEELPELIKPAWADLSDEVDEVGKRIEARETERLRRIGEARTKSDAAGKAEAARPPASDERSKFKSQLVDAADFAFQLRASILSGGDDTAKKQLAAQQQVAKNTEKTNDLLKKPRPATFA